MKTLAQTLKALSDPSRLRIINLLLDSGDLCVCDIEAVLKCTQTKVSRHLAYLKRAGLVEDRRSGLWMIYSLARPRSDEHRRTLEFIRHILRSEPVAQKDSENLGKRFQEGCCAVSSLVKRAAEHGLEKITNERNNHGTGTHQTGSQGALRKDCC